MLLPVSVQIALFSLTITFGPLIPLAAASSVNDESSLKKFSAVKPSITKEPFGTMPDGTQVDKYTLTSKHDVRVAVLTYGGIIQSIVVPDKNGQLGDIALGFDRLDDYMKSGHYFGAIVGRYANRIANGRFTLNGKEYQIPANSGPNSMHGGTRGFNQEVWAATLIEGPDWVAVELGYFSPDGQMGFPGDLAVTVRYTLNNDNALVIHYSAMTDKDTVLNLTNHSYFNLAGAGNGNVLDHIAMINADQFTPVNKTLIPTGELQRVNGTPLDFTSPAAIGAKIQSDETRSASGEAKLSGYDFNWVLNNPGNLNALAVRVTDPVSGRAVEMYTTEPAVQLYTANFLDGTLKGKGGQIYEHWGAFTLEAQHYPDSPNHANFPSTELRPGQIYTQTTIYRFLPFSE